VVYWISECVRCVRYEGYHLLILYHGTSSRHLTSILQNGLQPQGSGQSNYTDKIESKEGFVYLTTAYPIYFADNARGDDEDWVVLEVEIDEEHLYPDEDFLALAIKRAHGGDLLDWNETVDPTNFKKYWRASLQERGVVCTNRPEEVKIRNHVVISKEDVQAFLMLGGDASPSPLAYMLLGKHYRRAMEIMFDQGIEAAVEFAAKDMRPEGAGLPPFLRCPSLQMEGVVND